MLRKPAGDGGKRQITAEKELLTAKTPDVDGRITAGKR